MSRSDRRLAVAPRGERSGEPVTRYARARFVALSSRWSDQRAAPVKTRPHGSRAALLAIVGRLLDERLEQLQVFPGLGVPQHGQGEATGGVFDGFDCAVVRARGDAQPGAEPAEALVVMRLHRRVVAEQLGEPRALL